MNATSLLNNHLSRINPRISAEGVLPDGTQALKFNSPEEASSYMDDLMTGKASGLENYFNMHDGQVSPEFEEFLRTKAKRVNSAF